MMFDFVLEDGTGLENSTSYASVEFSNDYASFLGDEGWGDLPDIEKENLLIKATYFLDDLLIWQGTILNESQALNWPRTPFRDKNGRLVEGLPQPIVKATTQLAIYSQTGDLTSEVAELKSQSWGNASETYLTSITEDDSPVTSVKTLLARLQYGRSATAFITSTRA